MGWKTSPRDRRARRRGLAVRERLRNVHSRKLAYPGRRRAEHTRPNLQACRIANEDEDLDGAVRLDADRRDLKRGIARRQLVQNEPFVLDRARPRHLALARRPSMIDHLLPATHHERLAGLREPPHLMTDAGDRYARGEERDKEAERSPGG